LAALQIRTSGRLDRRFRRKILHVVRVPVSHGPGIQTEKHCFAFVTVVVNYIYIRNKLKLQLGKLS
jgi:hypothetical protein